MPLVVAALPEIILAIVGLILLYGLALLLKSVLQSLANHIPVVGGGLSQAIGAIINDAIALSYAVAAGVIHDIIGLMLAPVYWIERHIASVIDFFASLINSIGYIIHSLIPDTIRALQAQMLTYYHAAISYAEQESAGVVRLLNGDVAALYHTIAAVESALEQYTRELVGAAEAYTTAAIQEETRYVGQVESALQAEITAGLRAESAYATSLYHDAISYTDTLVTGVENTLIKDITEVTAWTTTQITALDHYIAATATATLATALDAVAVVEADLTELETGCTDNLCSGLSDLASLFNALQGDLGLAALFALAAGFAADPIGAAAGVRDTLGPVTSDAASAVRDLIGI